MWKRNAKTAAGDMIGRNAPNGKFIRSWSTPHLQTQGKIERWHRTLKKRVLLEN